MIYTWSLFEWFSRTWQVVWLATANGSRTPVAIKQAWDALFWVGGLGMAVSENVEVG